MIPLIQKIIRHYTKLKQSPTLWDLWEIDTMLLENQACLFVTLYHKWEICGSAGNIKEIKSNTAEELVENTLWALQDSRFTNIDINDAESVKIRVDMITERNIIPEWGIQHIDPVTHGILVLKKDYQHMAAILPNIDPKILTGNDYIGILGKKLWIKKFKEKEYIVYKIATQQETNF